MVHWVKDKLLHMHMAKEIDVKVNRWGTSSPEKITKNSFKERPIKNMTELRPQEISVKGTGEPSIELNFANPGNKTALEI